jgi:hypothetical protein
MTVIRGHSRLFGSEPNKGVLSSVHGQPRFPLGGSGRSFSLGQRIAPRLFEASHFALFIVYKLRYLKLKHIVARLPSNSVSCKLPALKFSRKCMHFFVSNTSLIEYDLTFSSSKANASLSFLAKYPAIKVTDSFPRLRFYVHSMNCIPMIALLSKNRPDILAPGHAQLAFAWHRESRRVLARAESDFP